MEGPVSDQHTSPCQYTSFTGQIYQNTSKQFVKPQILSLDSQMSLPVYV